MVYKAFISYSHAADGKLAPAVQVALQQFAKPWYRLRAIRVFRDETNLSANPDLWGSIEKALSESAYFILMSSPEAAASKWVKKEIDYWLKNKSADKILIILTDGIIEWDDEVGDFDWSKTTAVPQILKKTFARIPKYVDLSWVRKQEHLSRHQSAFKGAIALLAATLHDKPLDEIAGEDVRQHRKTVRLVWIVLMALLFLTISSVVTAIKATQNQRLAEKNQRVALTRQLAAQSQSALENNPQRSLLLALEAIATTTRKGELWTPMAEEALRQVLTNIGGRALSGHEGALSAMAISPDSRWLVTGSEDKTARLWDLMAKDPATATIILLGHEGPIVAIAISPDSHWLVTGSEDKTARLWDLKAKDPASSAIVLRGQKNSISKVAISADSRWLVTGSEDKTARLWDLMAKDPATATIILLGHEGPIVAIAISPDSHWLVTGSEDKTARLWDLKAKDPASSAIVLRGHEKSIDAIAISPDSHWLVTGSWEETARLWDLKAKDPASSAIALPGHEESIGKIAISPDSHWLVTGSWNKTARLWDLKAKDPVSSYIVLKGHEDSISEVAISPDSHWLVTGSWDKTARLWDLKAKDPASSHIVLKGHEDSISAVAISADSRWLVTGSLDRTSRLWDLRAKDPAATAIILRGHESPIVAIAISPDSHWLVSGFYREYSGYSSRLGEHNAETMRLWDLKAINPGTVALVLSDHPGKAIRRPVGEFSALGGAIPAPRVRAFTKYYASRIAIGVSPDCCWVVTGAESGEARLWDLTDKYSVPAPVVLRGHKDRVFCTDFSSDSRWLVTGSVDKTARLWDLKAKDPASSAIVLPNHEKSIRAIAISPDSRWLVMGSEDGTGCLWDLKTNDPVSTAIVLKGHEKSIDAIAISADSRWLATGSEDKTARLWDLKAKDPASSAIVLPGHKESIGKIAISPDSHWLVTGSWDKTARLWDLKAKDPASSYIVLKGHEESISAVAISPDSHWLATGSEDKTARLWDLKAKDPASSAIALPGHELDITALAISPDSRWLATGSEDKTARLWDLKAKDPLASYIVLRGHGDSIRAVVISPDSRWLVTGSGDGTVRLWNLRLNEVVDLACHTVGRNLTNEEWKQYLEKEPYEKTCANLPIHASVIESARDTARRGELKAAVAQFKRILKIEPNLALKPEEEAKRGYATFLVRKGKKSAKEGKIKEAIANYEKAEKIDPAMIISFESWDFLCGNGALTGFAQDVMPFCERAVELARDTEKYLARDSRGLARALTGNYPGAIEDFKEYVKWSKAINLYIGSEQKRERWINSLETGNNPFDEATLKDLPNEYPLSSLEAEGDRADSASVNPYKGLAFVYAKQKKYEKAFETCESAFEKGTAPTELWPDFFWVLKIYRKEDEIAKILEVVSRFNSKDPKYYYYLALEFNKIKKYDRQIEYCEKAIQLDSKYADAYADLGTALQNQKNYEDAIKSYRKAIELDPSLVYVYVNLGNILFGQRNYDEAVRNYRKSIELNPKSAYAYNGLGMALSHQGNNDEAIIYYQKAIECDPTYTPAYMNVGGLYFDKSPHNYPKAYEMYEKAYNYDPSDISAKANLAEASLATERFDKASALAREILNAKKASIAVNLAMQYVSISSSLFLDKRVEAYLELRNLAAYFRSLPRDYEQTWTFVGSKNFIAATSKLKKSDKALIGKLLEIFESPKTDADKKLEELESSYPEIFKQGGDRSNSGV